MFTTKEAGNDSCFISHVLYYLIVFFVITKIYVILLQYNQHFLHMVDSINNYIPFESRAYFFEGDQATGIMQYLHQIVRQNQQLKEYSI